MTAPSPTLIEEKPRTIAIQKKPASAKKPSLAHDSTSRIKPPLKAKASLQTDNKENARLSTAKKNPLKNVKPKKHSIEIQTDTSIDPFEDISNKTSVEKMRDALYDNLIELTPAIISLATGIIAQRTTSNPSMIIGLNILGLIASGAADYSLNDSGRKTIPNAFKRTFVMGSLGFAAAKLYQHFTDIKKTISAAGDLIADNDGARTKAIDEAITTFTKKQTEAVANDTILHNSLKKTLSDSLSDFVQNEANQTSLTKCVKEVLQDDASRQSLTKAASEILQDDESHKKVKETATTILSEIIKNKENQENLTKCVKEVLTDSENQAAIKTVIDNNKESLKEIITDSLYKALKNIPKNPYRWFYPKATS